MIYLYELTFNDLIKLIFDEMLNSCYHFDPITLIISEVVEPKRFQEYQIWATGINQVTRQFKGFLGIDIIQSCHQPHLEYVVIIKFDNDVHFQKWITSSLYQQWMEKSKDLFFVKSHQQLPQGIELKSQKPSYYQQVIVSVLSVYPLILLAKFLLTPLKEILHPLLCLLISVIFVSAVLTYPVMPWLAQLLNFWFAPSSNR